MAHPQVGSPVPAKLSFAKIAAMPAPNMAPALPNIIRDSRPRASGNPPQHARIDSQTVPTSEPATISKATSKDQINGVATSIANLSLTKDGPSAIHTLPGGNSGDSLDDDQSQLSISSLKQQSFDTKSMASVTTFAMDEKESIRPDDSASVRAVEEDDVHPGLSRNSSFQQELEVPPTLSRNHVIMLGPNVTISARRQPYTTLINPPRFGDLPMGPMPEPAILQSRENTESSSSSVDEVRPRPAISAPTPDEKLLEALTSVKDRLPLLQLEERIMAFIASGRDAALELPPQNSFTRLLTHKLADYYNLAHHINDENNSVRIFRTECRSLPMPLAEIAKAIPIGSQQISQATQFKIMRRVQLGGRQFSAGNSTAASSSVPSKTTSENGIETNSEEGFLSPAEGTPNKDRSKLTREEREAQYKAARERIFGDFQESVASESGSTEEASASMSRSSSSSGKKKSRKHKVPKDDTFEARSSLIASYAPVHMQPSYQQAYNEVQYPAAYSTGPYSPSAYSGTMSPSFPSFDPNMSYNNQGGNNTSTSAMYAQLDGWQASQQPSPGNFYNYSNPQLYQQHPMSLQMNNQYQQNSPSVVPQSPNWAPSQFPGMYMPGSTTPNNANWQAFGGRNMQGPMPYQYGQLPPQIPAGNVPYVNQHPVPGSFANTKSLFNPQTRSFVPSNSSARGGTRVGRKKTQTPTSSRASGTNSPATMNTGDSAPIKLKEDSLQQKYGTLANLPKKPPPSQVSPHFSHDHNAGNNVAPLVVNGNGKSSGS